MTTLPQTICELTDELNIVAARAALDGCRTDAQFSAWARRWGEPAMLALSELTAASGFEWRDE